MIMPWSTFHKNVNPSSVWLGLHGVAVSISITLLSHGCWSLLDPANLRCSTLSGSPNYTTNQFPDEAKVLQGIVNGEERHQGPARRANSDHNFSGSVTSFRDGHPAKIGDTRRHSSFGVHGFTSSNGAFPRPSPSYGINDIPRTSVLSNAAVSSYTLAHIQDNGSIPHAQYMSHQNFDPLTLPPPGFVPMDSGNMGGNVDGGYNTAVANTTNKAEFDETDMAYGIPSDTNMMVLEQINAPQAMPVFGSEGYRSPFAAMPEDLMAFLFNAPSLNELSPVDNSCERQVAYPNYPNTAQLQYQPYMGNDLSMSGFFPPNIPPQHPMAVTSILDTTLPENVLSEEKSQEIIDLIKERFKETDNAPVGRQKQSLLEGDLHDPSHMLSRNMMQTYIGSYWWHFHPQLPICRLTSQPGDADV